MVSTEDYCSQCTKNNGFKLTIIIILFQLVAATLRAMNQEMLRLKPENPITMSEDQGEAYASFTVVLAEV